MQLAVFEDSVILHVATLGDWQVTTAARLVKVSADLLSIASNRLSLRMFFLKSLFHFNLKNGWNIRFYWWKSCTWGFTFNHVFNGNKSAATWLLFLVVLISFGLVTPCKMKNNNNFVKSGGCPWNMPFCRKLLFFFGGGRGTLDWKTFSLSWFDFCLFSVWLWFHINLFSVAPSSPSATL